MFNKFLLREIREVGGAYGGGAYLRGNLFSFFSSNILIASIIQCFLLIIREFLEFIEALSWRVFDCELNSKLGLFSLITQETVKWISKNNSIHVKILVIIS